MPFCLSSITPGRNLGGQRLPFAPPLNVPPSREFSATMKCTRCSPPPLSPSLPQTGQDADTHRVALDIRHSRRGLLLRSGEDMSISPSYQRVFPRSWIRKACEHVPQAIQLLKLSSPRLGFCFMGAFGMVCTFQTGMTASQVLRGQPANFACRTIQHTALGKEAVVRGLKGPKHLGPLNAVRGPCRHVADGLPVEDLALVMPGSKILGAVEVDARGQPARRLLLRGTIPEKHFLHLN